MEEPFVNEFTKKVITQTQIMLALGKYRLPIPLHQFIHDTLYALSPVPRWFQYDLVNYVVTLSSDESSVELIRGAEEEGIGISDSAKEILMAKNFNTTKDVVTVVAIINGRLFNDRNRTTAAIRLEGKKRRFRLLNEENAILLRQKLYNEDLEKMGFAKIVNMHKTIKGNDGQKRLLNTDIYEGRECITARIDEYRNNWQPNTGFAFELLRIQL